jgi:hypothetical protein
VITLNSWQVKSLRLQGVPSQPSPVSANSTCDPTLFEIPAVLGSPGTLNDGSVSVLDGGGITLTLTGTGAVTSGCGDAAPPPLVVSPGDASLVITSLATPPSPNSVSFTASTSGCAGDGGVGAIWSTDQPGIASINEAGVLSLAFPYAGPIHVTAYAGTLSGTGTVNVTVNAVDTSGLPAGADAGGISNAFNTTCGVDAGGG